MTSTAHSHSPPAVQGPGTACSHLPSPLSPSIHLSGCCWPPPEPSCPSSRPHPWAESDLCPLTSPDHPSCPWGLDPLCQGFSKCVCASVYMHTYDLPLSDLPTQCRSTHPIQSQPLLTSKKNLPVHLGSSSHIPITEGCCDDCLGPPV